MDTLVSRNEEGSAPPMYGMLKVVAILQLCAFGLIAASIVWFTFEPAAGIGRQFNSLSPEHAWLVALLTMLASLCLLRLLLYLPALDTYVCTGVFSLPQHTRSFSRSFFTQAPFLVWGGVLTILSLNNAAVSENARPQLLCQQLGQSLGIFLMGLGLEELRRFLERLRGHTECYLPVHANPPVSYALFRFAWVLCILKIAASILQTSLWILDFKKLHFPIEDTLLLLAMENASVFLCGWSVCGLIRIWCEIRSYGKAPVTQRTNSKILGRAAVFFTLLVVFCMDVYSHPTFKWFQRVFSGNTNPFGVQVIPLLLQFVVWIGIQACWLIFLMQVLRWLRDREGPGPLPHAAMDRQPPNAGVWRTVSLFILFLSLILVRIPLYFSPIFLCTVGILAGSLAHTHRTLWLRAHATKA